MTIGFRSSEINSLKVGGILILGGTLGSKRQTMGEEPSKIHRLESGNIPFRNMQNTFTGLENAFAGPGWPWKPHKSKEQIFLHRNYILFFFSQLRKKNRDRNLFSEKKYRKKIREKNPRKNRDFFKIEKF